MGANEMSDRQLIFEYVPPSDLRDKWGVVKNGVEIVSKLSSEWIPEDVYSAIMSNHSTLHLGYEQGEFAGFLVLTPVMGFCETRLHVWIAYSEAGGIDVLGNGIVEINDLASKIKAKTITFDSNRPGWDRVADKYGFVAEYTRYSRKVES